MTIPSDVKIGGLWSTSRPSLYLLFLLCIDISTLFPIQPNLRSTYAIKEVKWSKPLLGFFKLNTDGCSKGNLGLVACGGLIKDEEGN